MKISTKGRYGLLIMLHLGRAYQENHFVSLGEIAEKEKISLKYLEKIMIGLRKKQFFVTSRGNSGGYRLKKAPKEYTILEILQAAEGNIDVTNCVKSEFSCPMKRNCHTFPVWKDLNDCIQNFLEQKTLEDYL